MVHIDDYLTRTTGSAYGCMNLQTIIVILNCESDLT